MMIMVMVICIDVGPCPKLYLLIRKQPLRHPPFYLSMNTPTLRLACCAWHLYGNSLIIMFCLSQLQYPGWHCRQQIVLTWAILHVFSLFLSLPLHQDLLNFDDPLNIDAAEHHLRDKVRFYWHARGDCILNSVLSSDINSVQTVTWVIDMQTIHFWSLPIVSQICLWSP